MKPLFCFQIDNKMKENSAKDLIVKRAPRSAINRIDKACDEENAYVMKKVSLPIAFNIIEMVLLLPAFFALYIAYDAISKESFEIIKDWAWIFVPGLISAIVLLIIFSVEKIRKHNYENSERYALHQNRLDRLFDSLYMEMGVPVDAPYTDIIYFSYRVKNGEIKPDVTGKYDRQYKLWNMKVFSDKKRLYLSTDEEMYAIDLEKIKGIRKTDKAAYLSADEKQKRRLEKFKKHNVKAGVLTGYKIQPYILEYEHKGEDWGIYFPHYELSVFENATGLKAK